MLTNINIVGGKLKLTAEVVDHPLAVDAEEGGHVGRVLGVLGLDVRLLLLSDADEGLGHLAHVHHAGSVLG